MGRVGGEGGGLGRGGGSGWWGVRVDVNEELKFWGKFTIFFFFFFFFLGGGGSGWGSGWM